jgi:hypothetical protein
MVQEVQGGLRLGWQSLDVHDSRVPEGLVATESQ